MTNRLLQAAALLAFAVTTLSWALLATMGVWVYMEAPPLTRGVLAVLTGVSAWVLVATFIHQVFTTIFVIPGVDADAE